MENKDYTLVYLLVIGFLGWQLWNVSGTLQTTKKDLDIYQSREQRTDEIIDNLRGFSK